MLVRNHGTRPGPRTVHSHPGDRRDRLRKTRPLRLKGLCERELDFIGGISGRLETEVFRCTVHSTKLTRFYERGCQEQTSSSTVCRFLFLTASSPSRLSSWTGS